MKNIIVSDEKRFEKIEKAFQEGGLDNVHVLADFDKTLTIAFVDGEKTPSIISVLRDGNYLTKDYADKAHALYNKYHPFENDPNIPKEEKKKMMSEWWTAHFKLLIDSGLNIEDIRKITKSKKIKFRDGFAKLTCFLKDNNIPLVIMSSSGLGHVFISEKLREEEKLSDNIHIISNSFEWDEKGRAIAVKQPIVHGANKDETLIQNFPEIFEIVKKRRNVILLGDSLGDARMAEGFDCDNLIKIGFFNNKENKDAYKDFYDILILNDSSLDFVNDFLKKIIK
ncbi:MAG: hypothetical protein ABH881_01990 [bacterium]